MGTSDAAAKAFVRHYVAVVNYAMRSGQTTELAELANARCSTCQAIVNRIARVYRNGGRLEGEGWTIVALKGIGTGDPNKVLVAAGIEISPQTAYINASSAPSASPRSRGNLDFSLRRRSSGWKVERLEATQ